jgi:copper chaperone CopZ
LKEKIIKISVGNLHCPDCLLTLSEVVLPKLNGVKSSQVKGNEIIVSIDEETLSESELLKFLRESGLLKP